MADSGARVLVVRLSSLGDVARLLPSLRSLSRAPGVAVADLTVEDRLASLLDLFPTGGRVIPYPRKAGGSPLRHPLRWSSAMRAYFSELRRSRYDLAIDLHGIFRSALVARWSGARETAGYARGFGREGSHLLYNRAVAPGDTPRLSRYARYAGTLRALGFAPPPEEYLEPNLPPAAREEAGGLLQGWGFAKAGYAFAFVGTSRAQAHKRWPLGHFAALAERLHAACGLATVIGWGPAEEGLVARLPSSPALRVAPLLGMGTTLALIRGARLFVGADTGFMHLSALMGVPTVAVMGPTDPVLNAPFGDRARVVHREGIRRACPGAGCDHRDCMGAVAPGEVLPAALGLLEAP